MARDTQTGVFDSCLAALPLQKPKTEQIPTESASGDGQCHHAFGKQSEFRYVRHRVEGLQTLRTGIESE